MRALPLLAALLWASSATAEPQLRAARAAGEIQVDGHLDEPDWSQAEPFTGFVQVFPGEGVAPSEATEVRVLYTERTLYVGIRCHDARPLDIVRPLGRRDSPPFSDSVTVLLDAADERRSALLFSLTAGGVQSDALVYDDDRITYEWDAPWDGAVQVGDDGWTAEIAIPLSVVRIRPGGGLDWRFGVIRDVARSHEKDATFVMPRTGGGMVTRLGSLGGIEGVVPGGGIEVVPYVAQRLAVRPQFSDPARPTPRLGDASTDVGVDLRASRSGMTFTGTVNPDFGQVEADQVLLNLTTFEPFFPEKRPFFTEGADALQPVGAGRETVPQQLFYSRRVGLDAPILGAAKLVGQPSDGLKVAVIDAVVMGAGQAPGATEDAPDRRVAWDAARPFHLGPADANPLTAPVTQNFFAGVARLRLSDEVTVGGQGVSAVPLAAPCSPADDAADARTRPSSCDAQGVNAAAVDFGAASRDGVWYAYGQAAASRAEGGPPARTLRDGTVLRRGDMGAGTYLRAGKRGGEGFRFDAAWTYAAPRLELNAAGFQRTQNEQELGTTVKYARTDAGPFHDVLLVAGGYDRWTTDGRGLSRGWGVAVGFDAQLKQPWLWASFRLRHNDPMYDVREIQGTGIPLRKPPTQEATLDVSTDEARQVSADFGAYVGRTVPVAPLAAPGYHGLSAGVAVRPHPRFETRVSAAYDRNGQAVRFVEDDGQGGLTLASLVAPTLSVTLRQVVVLTPRLTLQAYAQLFSAFEQYGPFYAASPRGTAPLEPAALAPAARPAANPDTHTSALVLNAVLRWEWRAGQTLYAVYARKQTELAAPAGEATPHALAPHALGRGPTTDSFLVKWSWALAR